MADAPTRVERILNLLASLLDTRQGLTLDELVRQVAGYPDDRSSARRAFERDKDTLREMGVPLTVATDGAGLARYRVRPEEYYLPDLGLDPEEAAALQVALQAVELDERSGSAASLKLGLGPSASPRVPLASLPAAPALAEVFDAYRKAAPVAFDYRGARRRVEPWALTSRWGHWYVVGHDPDRDAVRAFRADRIAGEVEIGAAGTVRRPEGFSVEEHLPDEPWRFGDAPPLTVRVLVDADHAAGFTDRADVEVVDTRSDGVVVELGVVHREAFRSFVLGFLDHAEVLEPPEARAEMIEWLRALATAEAS